MPPSSANTEDASCGEFWDADQSSRNAVFRIFFGGTLARWGDRQLQNGVID